MDWSRVESFNSEEFSSPDKPGSGMLMDTEMIRRLVIMRKHSSFPYIINSGYRTKEWNERIGGVANSAHLTGQAVDIRCVTSSDRFQILRFALLLGFRRIGVAKSFIHLDLALDRSQKVIWNY